MENNDGRGRGRPRKVKLEEEENEDMFDLVKRGRGNALSNPAIFVANRQMIVSVAAPVPIDTTPPNIPFMYIQMIATLERTKQQLEIEKQQLVERNRRIPKLEKRLKQYQEDEKRQVEAKTLSELRTLMKQLGDSLEEKRVLEECIEDYRRKAEVNEETIKTFGNVVNQKSEEVVLLQGRVVELEKQMDKERADHAAENENRMKTMAELESINEQLKADANDCKTKEANMKKDLKRQSKQIKNLRAQTQLLLSSNAIVKQEKLRKFDEQVPTPDNVVAIFNPAAASNPPPAAAQDPTVPSLAIVPVVGGFGGTLGLQPASSHQVDRQTASCYSHAKVTGRRGHYCVCEPHYRYSSARGLKGHIKRMSADKKFKCPKCGRDFLRCHEWLRHLWNVHRSTVMGAAAGCTECGERFSSRSMFQRHRQRVHVRGERHVFIDGRLPQGAGNGVRAIKYLPGLGEPQSSTDNVERIPPRRGRSSKRSTLTSCPSSFSRPWNGRLACIICETPTAFVTLEEYDQHCKEIHPDAGTPCPACPKRLGKLSLSRHFSSQHLYKKKSGLLLCEVCGDAFGRINDLTLHMSRNHKKVKPVRATSSNEEF